MKWSGYRRKENGEGAIVWGTKMKDMEGKMEFHKCGQLAYLISIGACLYG